jgi:hypothetical protein
VPEQRSRIRKAKTEGYGLLFSPSQPTCSTGTSSQDNTGEAKNRKENPMLKKISFTVSLLGFGTLQIVLTRG